MKNVVLTFSLAVAFLVAGCTTDKTERTVESRETTTETTTTEPATTTDRPAHGEPGHNHETDHLVGAVYSCPMHPEVTSPAPGNCTKCGMALEKMALPNESVNKPKL